MPEAEATTATPATEWTAATPLRRLTAAMTLSVTGKYIALLTPLNLLLALQMTRIEGTTGAAASFGVVAGFGGLIGLIANPLAGRISDRTFARLGRRRTWILTGGLAGAAMLVALSYATEVWQVVVAWCLVISCFAFQHAATTALLADQVPPTRRGSVSGLLGMAGALGPIIGFSIVGAFSVPRMQWLVIAIAAATFAVVATLLLRDPPQERPQGVRAGEVGQRLGVVALAKSFWINPLRHPAFGWAWIVRFLVTCGYASSTYSVLFLMDRFGVTPEEVTQLAVVLAIIPVVVISITSVLAGFISDRLQRQKPFVLLGGLISAGALVITGTSQSIGIALLGSAVLGIGVGMFLSIDNALCVRVLPDAENVGKDMSIFNMANTLPQSFVPFIAPMLLALGGFTAFYVTLAGFAVVGALAVLRIPEIGKEGDPRWAAITRAPAAGGER